MLYKKASPCYTLLMSSDDKKPQTVGDLVNSTYFGEVQETIKKFSEQREKALDAIRPTVERIAEMKRAFILPEVNRHVFVNYQPTDVLILRELRELNKKQTPSKVLSETDVVITYDTIDNSLNRNTGGKTFSYDLSEDGKRKKLLDILSTKKGYVQTDELRDSLKCPTNQAVAKIAQTFNDYATNALRLKKIKMIQGKKGSGYRINPKIVLEIENS
jgi:hypothetical protein